MASSSSAVQAEAFPDGTTDFVPLRGKKYDLKKPRKFTRDLETPSLPTAPY